MTEKTYQVVVIGEGSVGKSALCLLFVKGEFNIEYNPTIEDSYSIDVKVGDQTVKMSIIDTAGQEEYISLREQYYIKGDGFVLVYSIDNKNSFHALKNHRDSILGLRTGRKTIMVMAGNKCDLEEQRQIPNEEAKKLAEEWKIPFFETSAQNNINVTELFNSIASELLKSSQEETAATPSTAAPSQTQQESQSNSEDNKKSKKEKKKGKCILF
ncbi:hypothetical protein, conserved [Entamoeba dispar SAW760]|uniref:small monomeric GTPase n=1 Tax=Entamoeba dispar (strain ATCC PRA-260 / SAW760) TaxID=370354 RepID=B0ESN8_ENTDS|nr:uncharacterized protein EDI_039630 [Entamoeba dispar SAW760]EDR22465.1 hypothetical protein, conserved [Entamoeba dispar SAW760]|eukprot:EDR22465.1 hypothetical protein, conserved [Entamoeba dispar SAW760]